MNNEFPKDVTSPVPTQRPGPEPKQPEASGEPPTHTRSCPALIPNRWEDCTCGLRFRIQFRTEQEMHNAWRKRATDAERENVELRKRLAGLVEAMADSPLITMHIAHHSRDYCDGYLAAAHEWDEFVTKILAAARAAQEG